MKWYNYKDDWINIEKVDAFHIYETSYPNQKNGLNISFHFGDSRKIVSWTPNESDAEFEKIKALMGIKDYTSRCC